MKVVDEICTKVSTASGLVEAKDQPVIESIRVTCIDSEFQKKPEVTHTARIEIENYGVIELELYGNMAPITVANFEKLANEGFYNGLTFHRIMKNFMMQGGCPEGDGRGDSGTDIKGEFLQNQVINTLTHERGVISMARSNEPNSGSCQFFIVHKTYPSLDGAYAAFGRVTSGIEIVDKICEDAKPTDNNGSISKDAQPVIKTITVMAK
ncbi:MAG: peptidylprolyl isomerase [Ruminococcaceae bacterium]|nr:peptidylprolyl isomerase [Oscillospiraceae bacterium]